MTENSNTDKKESWVSKLLIPGLIALILGTTKPFWWPSEEIPVIVKPITIPPEDVTGSGTLVGGGGNNVLINGGTNNINVGNQTTAPQEDFKARWECIPLADRPSSENISKTKPSKSQLNNAILAMIVFAETGCVQTLLNLGADVNAYSTSKLYSFGDGPPLHLALNRRNWPLSQLLLKSGADPTLLTSWQGYTALRMANDFDAPPELIAAIEKQIEKIEQMNDSISVIN